VITTALILVCIVFMYVNVRLRLAQVNTSAMSRRRIAEIACGDVWNLLLQIVLMVLCCNLVICIIFAPQLLHDNVVPSQGQLLLECVAIFVFWYLAARFASIVLNAELLISKARHLANRLGWRMSQALQELAVLTTAVSCFERAGGPEYQAAVLRWYLLRAQNAVSVGNWSLALRCADTGCTECFSWLAQDSLTQDGV